MKLYYNGQLKSDDGKPPVTVGNGEEFHLSYTINTEGEIEMGEYGLTPRTKARRRTQAYLDTRHTSRRQPTDSALPLQGRLGESDMRQIVDITYHDIDNNIQVKRFSGYIVIEANGTLSVMDYGLVAAFGPGVWLTVITINPDDIADGASVNASRTPQ